MTSIAFFDLDRTLLAINSGSRWLKAEYREGNVTPRQFVWALGWLLRYHLGLAEMDGMLRQAIAAYAGEPETQLRDRTQRFFAREVAAHVRPGARRALAAHRKKGDPCVLLTTSSNYLSAAVTEAVGLDGYLSTRFATDDAGRLTGQPIEPLCYGTGKVILARRYADERGVDLRACAFYSDSVTDLPMLEAAGHPVAVNPDPRLRRIARRRGWPVEMWGEP
ncbi:MAG: HAD family hydrolase [Myxococcales bacterium]|nr:HAD family hydrolase [Myxococcales bacterium]